jgi:acetyltransferase-like isoleucine patch superfamily enzyme
MRRAASAFLAPPPSAFASFGEGSVIVPPARVEAPEFIHIGDRVIIHEDAWISAQTGKNDSLPSLSFGSDTRIQRFVKIICHGSITIGRGVLIADRVYISDVEYVPGYRRVDNCGRPMTEPLPIAIEDGAFIGMGAVVKPGVKIGKFAYVAVNSIVTEDVPERTMVVGAPARAVRRWRPGTPD